MTPLQRKFHKLIRAAGAFDDRYYALYNPDVAAQGGDLLEHYLVRGEAEGRRPTACFDPEWYRLQSPRVPAGGNLLAHYLVVGDRDGLQPMVGIDPAHVRAQFPQRREPALVLFNRARAAGRLVNPNRLFDYGWYLAQYPDVAAAADIDAYHHFVDYGADEGRVPSAGFDWDAIRARHQIAGSNSEVYRQLMLRWREAGAPAAEGPRPVALLRAAVGAAHRPGPAHEAPGPSAPRTRRCELYAVYAPEFQRSAEHAAWSGEGTDPWHGVIAQLPAFAGHVQPRVPTSLGFYDLADPAVLRRQVALATGAGISGFAWRYHNFGARRLFEAPLEHLLADPSIDTGFFLVWMNQDWVRIGAGGVVDPLIRQRYTPGFVDALAADVARHVRDVRYRRLGGRPLLVIDRPLELPDCAAWIERFRAACAVQGFAPQLFQVQRSDSPDPTALGLDGGLALEPHRSGWALPAVKPEASLGVTPESRLIDYAALAAAAMARVESHYPLIRGCTTAWDDGPQRRSLGLTVTGATPARFEAWLRAAVDAAGETGLVCLSGWNAWGEGGHVEPDMHWGHAWLNAVRRVMCGA